MMEVSTAINISLTVIGGATILFRAIAPLTKTNLDNIVLKYLTLILEYVAINKNDHGDSTIEIKLNNR